MVEMKRKEILEDSRVIDITDVKTGRSRRATIGDVAKRASSQPKFSNFLRLLCEQLEIKTVLETGTSLGINCQYLAEANCVEKVVSIEGSKIIHDLANKNVNRNPKIELLYGDIQSLLEMTIVKYQPELIFLDADHRSEAVHFCVEKIMQHVPDVKCIVIHDIYWSEDMTSGWKDILSNPNFKLTVDIFQAGLVFPNYPIEKQHFVLKF